MQLTDKQLEALSLLCDYQLKHPTHKIPRAGQLATEARKGGGSKDYYELKMSLSACLGHLERKGLVKGIPYTNGYSSYNRWQLTKGGWEYMKVPKGLIPPNA